MPNPTSRRGRPAYPLLTPAEERVLEHLRKGQTNAEIATRLGVTPDAVKYHVSNMLGKLDLENREQLKRWQEPTGLRRALLGIPTLIWKTAAVVGALAVTGVVVVVALGFFSSNSDDQPDSVADLFTGVVTIGIDGQPPNGNSYSPSISSDGRFIVFESVASNLVKDDSNGVSDVFLFDRALRETRRISLAPGGTEANGASYRPVISGDGKWVAFDSEASNLEKDDRNGEFDQAREHAPENFFDSFGANVDGRDAFIAQASRWAGSDIFVVELATGEVELASVATGGEKGNLGSFWPSISYDGRYVVFESSAPNLVAADRARLAPPAIAGFTGFASDVLLRDRQAGTTIRLSIGNDGTEPFLSSGGPSITPDGKFISLVSGAPDLAGPRQRQTKTGYVWSRETGKLRVVQEPELPQDADFVFSSGFSRIAISADGQLLAYQAGFDTSNAARDQSELRGCFVEVAGEATSRVVDSTALWCTASGGTVGPALLGREMVYPFSGDGGQLMTYDIDSMTYDSVQLPPGFQNFFGPAAVVSPSGKWIAGTASSPTQLDPSGAPLLQIIVFSR